MSQRTTTLIINILLLALVVMSGFVAAYRHRLPSDSDPETPEAQVNTADSGAYEATIPADSVCDSTGVQSTETVNSHADRIGSATTITVPDADLHRMRPESHPFASEARKILSGGLELTDSLNRRKILNYCEHFRMAYNTRDIDFIRQVFSEDALIIVGHTVKPVSSPRGVSSSATVRYSMRTKSEYLRNLTDVFAANKKIAVEFSGFTISRHPTMEGIYGVTLRQKFESDIYSDEGYLFLLWDFRDSSMPRIHVRTWQPGSSIAEEDDIIGIGDFNLQ